VIVIDFSQYRPEMPIYGSGTSYQSDMYSAYNMPKNYSKRAEGYQFEYPPASSTPSYAEPAIRNFGVYNKEIESAASSQFNYARGFAQTPYSGFYSEPFFGTPFSLS